MQNMHVLLYSTSGQNQHVSTVHTNTTFKEQNKQNMNTIK